VWSYREFFITFYKKKNIMVSREWVNIPKDEQKCGYWKAVPKNTDSIIDGLDYEVVYVYYNGRWLVMRICDNMTYSFEDFTWFKKLDLD